ncbi:hypothetical protein E3T61_21185 [Cryobacterium lactosi]|uniref:Uncharacterized protein n=1 Tax=Cryobacterium lactosi TaxID=1259202 RepID=A0A4R9BI26_9MICO|nr:hypothetical protein [Cryobacterium lactosi]TFD83549.1 hypothetical protein E3T61_21185 [Cryobacterium lactosi]
MTGRTTSAAVLLIAAMMLAGCAEAPAASYDRTEGDGDSWFVGAKDPRFESLSLCIDDPSVGTSLQSADMPSSRLSMQLVAGSTEEDAIRIADCLGDALTSGQIWITSPRT